MPQTGPDLPGAGYPISRPLTALLGGTGNVAAGNVPVASNLDFGMGNLTDVLVGSVQAGGGSVLSMAVPVTPGQVITKMSLVTGAGGGASITSASVTNLWAALYTGSGSAPGTTGAQPTYIASAAANGSAGTPLAGSVAIGTQSLLTFNFAAPVTITSTMAPFGYVYASYSITTGGASPSALSFISTTCASVAEFPWFSTSPFSLYMSSNAATGSAVPTAIGTATRVVNPPIVLLY